MFLSIKHTHPFLILFFFFGLLQCYNSNYASFQMVEIIWNYFSALEVKSNSAEIK